MSRIPYLDIAWEVHLNPISIPSHRAVCQSWPSAGLFCRNASLRVVGNFTCSDSLALYLFYLLCYSRRVSHFTQHLPCYRPR